MSNETITGFDIPLRQLTDEEANREITLERFDEFHAEAGEDFMDSCGHILNTAILVGFLIGKQPQISRTLLNAVNHGADANDLRNVYIDQIGTETKFLEVEDIFYSDLAEFLNLTEHAKKRVNQILIQVTEKS